MPVGGRFYLIMKIKKLEKAIGWTIECDSSEEYKAIEPFISCLLDEYCEDGEPLDSDIKGAIEDLLDSLE